MMPEGHDLNIELLTEAEASFGMKQSHFHDYYEIFYLLEGKRRYFINHTIFDVLPSDVIFVNKTDLHMSQSVAPGQRYARYLLSFSDAFLDSLGPAFNKDFLLKIFETKKLHIPESMQNSFNILIHKTESKIHNEDIFSKYSVKLTFLEILVMLNKLAAKNAYPLMDNVNIYEDRIQDVCHYICNYYNEPITLEQMAKIAYMSPTYFSKKFKRVTGFGFKEYLNNIRIKMATNMLMESQYSITEIASFCGYHDSNYFGDVFKKIIGVSPNKYRKDHYII